MTTSIPRLPPHKASNSSSSWIAPDWVRGFYTRLPLVVHDQEDDLARRKSPIKSESSCSLWIHPPSSTRHPHYRSWASSSPTSLRTQLLFLLRHPHVPVDFREWSNEDTAPGGTLPALHITAEDRLLSTEEIRGWLDAKYLMADGLNGMSDQAAFDRALAVAQLVLGPLHRAYLASLPIPSADFNLQFPVPPPLAAGLITPLPPSLTGDARSVDLDHVSRKGIQAIDALEVLLGTGWTLGASLPTPLDALIASHLYVIYALPEMTGMRTSLEERSAVGEYVDRVFAFAEMRIS